MKNRLNSLLAIGTFLVGFGSVATAFCHGQRTVGVQSADSLRVGSDVSSELIPTKSIISDNEDAKSQVQNYQSQLSNLLQSYLRKISNCLEAVKSEYTTKFQQVHDNWNDKLQTLIDDYYLKSELSSHLSEALTFFTNGSEELASIYNEAYEANINAKENETAKNTVESYQSQLNTKCDMYIGKLSTLEDDYVKYEHTILLQNSHDSWWNKLQSLIDTYFPNKELCNHLTDAKSFFTSGSEELANIYNAAFAAQSDSSTYLHSISVSMSESTDMSYYKNMWLELSNIKSGQCIHYVITDCTQYTFANIIRNSTWNVVLRNEHGDIFGRIDNVEVKDNDVNVTFSSLSKPQSAFLNVLTPDGKDVTSQTKITWTDAQGNYVAQGVSLTGLPTGYKTTYSVVLSQELAMAYNTPQPVDYTITDDDNKITCQLNAIPQVKISGKVKDASTGLPISGAVISASQTFGGKYSKTLNAKTDANGMFTFGIANVPTSIAFAASDYVSQTVNCDSLLTGAGEVTLPDVSLKTITGATISLGFTYTSCDGETQNWYSDYQNVNYELFNVNKNKVVSQYNVQYPQIVLLEEVEDGDVLKLTATSRTNAFMPVTTTATIAEQKAEATFAVVELGKIQSSFTSTGNATVVGSLYDAAGKLLKTYNYSEASFVINDLADGNYTLVSMGSSRLFNTIYDLSQLPQTGLVEGIDYVQNSVEVKSGQVSAISINVVPTLDESKLYYTGDNTSFTVNKPSIVAGNYLTLTGRIDFKPAYATSVSNVQMIVDLPESCEFVENSVMVGNSTSSYTLNGHQIIIPMARYTDRVRFCVIPTLGGEYAPSAFAQFDMNGETVTQPIGSANYTAKDLSISVPSTVAKTSIPVSGTAIGKCDIEIYDNGVLIGQTTSMANGTWATTCELNEPYNLSRHQIYAKVTTKTGMSLTSEIQSCTYNKDDIFAKTVDMTFYNAWMRKNITVTFDLENKTSDATSYSFYHETDFTFAANLSNNDTTVVKGVTIGVYTDHKGWMDLEATYNEKLDRWVAVHKFGSDNLPTGVKVDIDADNDFCLDAKVIENGFESAKYFQEVITANTYVTDNLASEILECIESQSSSKQEIERLVSNLLESINYKDNVVLNNSSVSNLLNTTEELLNMGLTELFSIAPTDYEKLSEYLEGFTIKTCKDLNDQTLEKEGYVKVKCTDEKDYFYKVSDEECSIVYLPLSICIDYKITDYSTNRSQFSHANNNIDDLTTWQGKVYLLCDRLIQTVSIVTNVVDGVIDHVDKLGSECTKQISENLGRLLEDAENPMLTQKEIDDLTKANVKLAKQFKKCEAISSWLNKNLKQFKVSDGAGTAFSLFDIYSITNSIKDDGGNIISLYYSVPDCPNDNDDDILRNNIRNWGIGCFAFYAGKLAADIVQINSVVAGVTGAIPTGGTSLSAVAIALGIAAGNFAAEQAYSWQFEKNKDRFKNLISKIRCSDDKCPKCGKNPCECKEPCPICGHKPCVCCHYCHHYPCTCSFCSKCGKRIQQCICKKCPKCGKVDCICKPIPEIPPILDPSGYVYEGVTSNRIEGVAATVYYKETVEDMYGDKHENIVKWDAAEYAQENPLFTDENGYYRWDVPQGLWQVKFEKEGYETAYSEWLPVPPPQLDVNIAMKQNVQPNVKNARAFEDAVEVEFDKYMIPELLNTENITMMVDGKNVEGTIELLNEEVSSEGETETFVSKARFNAVKPFDATEVTVMVNNRVKSYAGIRMQDNYRQTFTIEQEIKQIVSDSIVTVGYGNTSTFVVSVLPASASKGKTLTVKTSSPMILGVETEQVTISNDGKAEIAVSGNLPGTAALTFSVEGTDKTAMTIANVEQIVVKTVAIPKASIASGTAVDKGTAITLSCETEGATIYYTLDGSCPCENTDARKVYDGTPIIINETVTIKAMAMAPDMYESDIAEFTYLVDATGIDDISVNNQIQIYPLPVRDKVNISAGGRTIKSVTIVSMSGAVVTSISKPATIVTLDVGFVAAGIYVINIQTEDNIYSQKVLIVQ